MKVIRYMGWFLVTFVMLVVALLQPLLGKGQVAAVGMRPNIETAIVNDSVSDAELLGQMERTQESQLPQFTQVDETYFRDALFIGDSRTVGLYKHGGLGEADVFADEGLTVFRLFQVKAEYGDGEKTLEELLTGKNYGKIYIMLGINELGYRMERSVEKYREVLATIRQLQPNALIFLQANLHVTKDFSQKDETFTNPKINEINTAIAQMADGRTGFYIDVNELFDDGEGNLDVAYASDELHIQVKYYSLWVQWILGKGILL